MANIDDNKLLSDVIRGARAQAGLSLRDLAKRLDKTPSYLSDIENDRRVPSEEVLRDIARELSLDFDDLMARAGRFGEEAERYLARTPAVGVLFRRLASENASADVVAKLMKLADRSIGKKGSR